MTQANLLDPLIALNNQGCYLVGKGEHNDAMGQFKAALVYLRSSLYRNGETNNKTLLMMDGGISLPSLLPLHLKDLKKMLSAYEKGSGAATDDTSLLSADTGHYVTFSWALPIVPGYNFSCQTADNEKVLTAVVVFNLALTLHLRALDCRGGGGGGCCSSSCSGCSCLHHGLLKKAQSLYFHTHQLIVPIVNASLRHGLTSDNVAFDLLVMGLLNNTALVHRELLESADCLGAFQRLIQYVKISSFRLRAATCRLYPHRHDEDAPPPFVVGSVDPVARSIRITTTSRHNHNAHDQVGQPEPNRSTSSPEEEGELCRIHRMVDQMVNDLIWNATYQKLNVRMMDVAVAA